MTHVAQYNRWWCDRCKGYGDIPPGALTPMDPKTAATAKKLVMWSHILGWGGIGMLFIGSIVGGALAGPAGGATAAGIGLVSAVTGAILGQVGRGLQGRVI